MKSQNRSNSFKRGEIYKNIALILVQKEKQAKKAVSDARLANQKTPH
jgi:hypothetical protein